MLFLTCGRKLNNPLESLIVTAAIPPLPPRGTTDHRADAATTTTTTGLPRSRNKDP